MDTECTPRKRISPRTRVVMVRGSGQAPAAGRAASLPSTMPWRASWHSSPCPARPRKPSPSSTSKPPACRRRPAARATEIAAVLVRDGQIVGHYASLMRSGAWVPPFIEQLTGISNAMLAARAARRAGDARGRRVRRRQPAGRAQRGLRPCVLVRRTAARRRARHTHRFACTMLLARRLYPAERQPPARHAGRAAPAACRPGAPTARWPTPSVTAQLLLQMQRDVMQRFALPAGTARAADAPAARGARQSGSVRGEPSRRAKASAIA